MKAINEPDLRSSCILTIFLHTLKYFTITWTPGNSPIFLAFYICMVNSASSNNPVAYFCAEYGISENLPLYAGGLGILAGDYVKQASDMNFPVCAVGLLYQGKYAIQKINPDGWQEEIDNLYKPENVGLDPVKDGNKPLYVVVNLTGEDVWINAYKKTLGANTTLYLLTTDNEHNSPIWKNAMVADYCCDDENQLRQMMILGIGGIKILRALKIKPSIYHINEGRPIFLNWELIHQIMHDEEISFEEASVQAKNQTVYTNHTLLRSGNLMYHPLSIKKYAAGYVNALGEETDKLIEPGIDPLTKQFSISQFALNISLKASAVSKIHTKFSKKQWPQFYWECITNGIHLPTWQDSAFREKGLSFEKIWEVHLNKKRELKEIVYKRTGFNYEENKMVISWARRITDYKRLTSLFTDIVRFTAILKNQQRPIQLLVAGKGHYGDDAAKRIIQQIIKYMQNELSGCALFIPNYDIELAQKMVSGSDVWLNTPEFGLEASGTSGMKAISNGVLNLTVSDGWANEVNWQGIGWTLDPKNISVSLYDKLENEIAPLFFQKDENNMPIKWIEMMEKSINLSEKFSAKRMLNEYIKKLYTI